MSVSDLRELESVYLAGRSPTAYIPYARALLESKAFTRALEVCLRGLEADPDSLTGRLLLGEIYFDMGRYDAALRAISEAQCRAPRSYRVNLMLARVLVKRREFDTALEIVRALRHEHPFDPDLMKIERGIQDELQMESTSQIKRKREQKKHSDTIDSRLEDLMAYLKSAKGVVGFSMVQIDAHATPTETELALSPSLRAILEIVRELRSVLARREAGELRQGVVELDKGCVLFFTMSGGVLIILADSSASVGRLRYSVESVFGD